jgi:fatty acid/phospholipid biosynthesis enzyme
LSQRFGIDKRDIVKHPEVMALFPTTIENHTMLLEEGGFSDVTSKELVRYVNNISAYVDSVVLVD